MGATGDGGPEPRRVRPRLDDGFASRRERRLWLVGYIVVIVVVGIGAVRIMIKQFG